MASRKVLDLNELQRKEARSAVNTLTQLGLGSFSVKELEAALPDAGASCTTWRNIRYGQEGDRRLQVYRAADFLQPEPGASVPFGERMQVAEQKTEGNNLWLKLRSGTFANKWVVAQEGSTRKCTCLDDWKGHDGRIPDTAFEGQDFPSSGMYTEGYEGSSGICLVSASGDAFWREVNIEMLFRDIATATVFEKQWGGDANFTDWVAYYAGNILTFGHLRTAAPKQLVVTVKHTSRWRQYLPGQCLGPDVEAVTADIGKAQAKECQWLHSMKQRWELKWDEVEFITAFSFLRKYCGWSMGDCWRAAVGKLAALCRGWAKTSFKKRAYLLESAVWCLDEAFEQQPAAKNQLSAQESDDLRRLLMSLTRKERSDFLQGDPVDAMKQWMGWQDETWARIAAECGWIKVLERRSRDDEDLDMPDSRGQTLAHLAARGGQVQVLHLFFGTGLDVKDLADECAKDDKGRTPAYIAAEYGQLPSLKEAEFWGIDLADHSGMTARKLKEQLEQRVSHVCGGLADDARSPVTAAEKGDAAVLQALHCKGKDLDLEGKSGAAPARAAARNGCVEVLRLLAELGLDLDTQDDSGKSLAHDAAGSGQQEVLRFLADRGAPLDLKDTDGEAPAHLAAEIGHVGALKVLADSGADLNLEDLLGRVPAHLASAEGQVEALKLLRDSGANLNHTAKDGEAPVHFAAKEGRVEALKLLAGNGADLNLFNKDGAAPAHLAAKGGHVEALKLLVDKGADPDLTNKDGESPAHSAAKRGHVGALNLLASSGADLNLGNKEGEAPAFLAAKEGHPEALKLLADRGAGLNYLNKDGEGLVHLAARGGHTDVLSVLVGTRADPNLVARNRQTPAHMAAVSGCAAALKLLADSGADLSLKGPNCRVPMHETAGEGHVEVLRLLADRRCDLNARDWYGQTPAMYAAARDQVGALRYLADNRADLNLRRIDGWTPKDAATFGSSSRVLAFLQELQAD